MDIVRLCIPYDFIRERTRMTWREVLFGLVSELLDPRAPVEFAVEQVGTEAEPSTVLLQLAGGRGDEETTGLVSQLAEDEASRSEDEVRDKWLYIVLAWIYQHREQSPDPLRRVEEVYADFAYPEQIAKFVRYMPMVGPDLGGPEANERRLFERWKEFLDDAARTYASQ